MKEVALLRLCAFYLLYVSLRGHTHSEASETLSGLFNRESQYIYSMYVVFALRLLATLITCEEGGA